MRYLTILVALLAMGANAQDAPPPNAAAAEPQGTNFSAEQFEASLKFQQGDITLPNGIALLQIPRGFRYLGPEDAQRILEQAWGNPSGEGTLGMLFPADVSPLADESWGVVITYEEDGYIPDSDADSINYDDMLKEMKESSAANNAERKKQGFEAVDLVGWAAKPYYDKTTKKMYWAKELKFAGAEENTLNYNVRVLGRKGVLVLNAVAGMNQLPSIKTNMQEVLAFTNFTQGNAYADFDAKVDKRAAYGLAALVAGGVAAKTGFLAKLFVLLMAGKKFLFLAAVALFGFIPKLLGRRKKQAAAASQEQPPTSV
jgi:uncharacterized membrane-anchored protein